MKCFQVWLGQKPNPYPEYCLKNKEIAQRYLMIGDIGEALEDNRVAFLMRRAINYAEQSDLYRFWFLSKHPNWTYVDCDAFLRNEPDIYKPGLPYFAEHKHGADAFIIHGNGNGEFFNRLLFDIKTTVERQKIRIAFAQHTIVRRCTNVIPREYFIHKK